MEAIAIGLYLLVCVVVGINQIDDVRRTTGEALSDAILWPLTLAVLIARRAWAIVVRGDI